MTDQNTSAPKTPRQYTLSGKLSQNFMSFTAPSGEKVSTFLIERPNRVDADGKSHPMPNQYLTMSRMTFENLKNGVESGRIDLDRPVSAKGSYFPSKTQNKKGRQHRDGFHAIKIYQQRPVAKGA